MDRLEAMRLLVAVAEEGTLAAASRRLGVPVSTVHRNVRELESHLGSQLFDRSTRRTALTAPGRAYVAASRDILEQVDEAERQARGEFAAPRGEVVITAPIVLGRLHIAPLIARFMADYPDICVRLLLVDRLVNLSEEHVDLAVRIGALADSRVIAASVGHVRHVCCASRAYLDAHGRPATPPDLEHHQCIAVGAVDERHAWAFAECGKVVQQSIEPRATITTADGAVAAARHHAGITRVLSYQVSDAIRERALERVLEAWEPPVWPAHILFRRQAHMPCKLRVLVDFLKPRLRDRLSQSLAVFETV